MNHFLYGAHVHANGIRQHYLRFGGTAGPRSDRDPVILVPGITSPAATWGFVAEQLGAHLDCYVVDVRGRGLSQAGAGMDYSLDAQAADLVALAHALGLDRYSVLGHSMGARIAVVCDKLTPDQVRDRMKQILPQLTNEQIVISYYNPLGVINNTCDKASCKAVEVSLTGVSFAPISPFMAFGAVALPDFRTYLLRESMEAVDAAGDQNPVCFN